MSDIPTDYRDRLNIREQIARIDNALDEAAKFRAEAGKYHRDPWLLVLTGCLTGFLAIIAAIVARLPEILHAMGVGP